MSYKLSEVKYVVIQAGGLGSRMDKFTKNKPKCLVPYKGKTIIEHLINLFHGKKIFIICDYMKETLKNYVRNILKRNDIIFIDAKHKSTTSGLEIFSNHIEYDEPFIVSWSDLVIEEIFDFESTKPVSIGLTDNFECRWTVIGNELIKTKGNKDGVIGFFSFSCKSVIENFETSQSLVGGNLSKLDSNLIEYFKIEKIFEIGTYENYLSVIKSSNKCRFFNDVQIDHQNKLVTKKCVDSNYDNLLNNEINWYENLKGRINFVPLIVSKKPLVLDLVDGEHIFDITLTNEDKYRVINSIIKNLNTLHSLEKASSRYSDMEEIYLNKTIDRVNSIKSMIPDFNSVEFKINGKKIINPFNHNFFNKFISDIKTLFVNDYVLIHGDPTFSNILVNKNYESFLIDPRGIFGNTLLYGDKNYDWAKLFYSVNGNYDSINSKQFEVSFENDNVNLNIKSNGFEFLSDLVIESSGMKKREMLLHQSLIWLSLTGYVKEDIDSILYSFYYGVYLWNLSQE